jgi:uncharacterized caspase-like protein
MLRYAAYLAVFFAFVMGAFAPASAEKRVALVIGNSAYEHSAPLKNPENDANAIAALLERLGFDVLKGINLTDKGFGRTIGDFSQKLDAGADVAVFFYAGHGLQVHGRNYLAPVDARLDREASLDFEAVRLNTILTLMERGNGTNLVFLDACRDNPLARNLARNMGTRSSAIGRGLARVEAGVGTLIAYATQPGNVALDGDSTHSPFAAALLKHAETPGLEIEALMRRVRRDVIDATDGAQVPWNHSSLTAPFLFKSEEKEGTEPVAKSTSGPAIDTVAVELAFWQAAKDADTRAAYEAYLAKYPKGNFAPLVRIKLEEIAQAEAAKAELEAARKKQAEAEQQTEQKLAALQPQDQPAAEARLEALDAHTMTLVLQNELKRVGCDPGKIDGIWGQKGRAALRAFNKQTGSALATGQPTPEAITEIRNRKTGVCVPVKPVNTNIPTTNKKRTTAEAKAPVVKNDPANNERGQFMRPGQIGRGKAWKNLDDYCSTFPNSINCWARH